MKKTFDARQFTHGLNRHQQNYVEKDNRKKIIHDTYLQQKKQYVSLKICHKYIL